MYQRKNFAYGKVATAPSPAASGTSITLESGQGARFPNTSGGTYICVVKQTNLPATPDIAEVVLVTSHDPAGDVFTITREQEGSSARTIEVGDEFYLSPTDGVWDQIDKLTTKGDLLGFSTEYVRVPVGTDTYILTADSTEASGIKWKPLGTESQIKGEVPTGDIDGVNDEFTLANTPFTDTLALYLNGVRQKVTDDYTLSTATITFITPPLSGSKKILADYNLNVSPSGNADTLDNYHANTTPTANTIPVLDANAKMPVAALYSDGWTPAGETWTYASATTITVPSGAASKYQKGDKIKLTQTTVKYFYIIGVADTVLTVTGGSDYTVANAAITANYYSHESSPIGFPTYFNTAAISFSTTYTDNGSGSAITSSASKFSINGGVVSHSIIISGNSYKVDTNPTWARFTIPSTLPTLASFLNGSGYLGLANRLIAATQYAGGGSNVYLAADSNINDNVQSNGWDVGYSYIF